VRKGERGKGEMICVRKECMENNLQEPPAFMPSPKDSTPLQPGYFAQKPKTPLTAPPRFPSTFRYQRNQGGAIAGGADMEKYSCLLRDPGLMFQELRRVDA